MTGSDPQVSPRACRAFPHRQITSSLALTNRLYFAAFFAFAHRAFCAAAILARASGDN